MTLDDPVSALPGVGPASVKKLKNLGVNTIEDLLWHIPRRFLDYRNTSSIGNLEIGEVVTVVGQVVSMQNVYTKTKKLIQIAKVSDGVRSVTAIWMNRPYLNRVLPEGSLISLSGKYNFWGKQKAFVFPDYELISEGSTEPGRLVPIYPETAGVNSKWLGNRAKYALSHIELDDFIDENALKKLELLSIQGALLSAHMPEKPEDYDTAYERLAFDEVLMLQIKNNLNKIWWRENTKSQKLTLSSDNLTEFMGKLPFELTGAQEKAVKEVLDDVSEEIAMNRLLEGDVGSGKTVVAATAAFASFVNGKKSVLLAPTQILAQQHFETMNNLLSPFNVRVALVTSEGVQKGLGSTDVVVGTHALLFNGDFVENAALVVIDEQHRFGVKQRAKIKKLATSGNMVPHMLTMTATPIPRTIALTIYGDLNLSSLDELPKGRKSVKTWLVPKGKRKSAEHWIDEQIGDGAQVFVVCPIIEESDSETMQSVKAATAEFERLRQVFKKRKIALLHGRMKAKEKSKILNEFKDKKYDILVSTPVIEVGIDVPNASIMVIEAAERFGLAQLHQLRGRVGRGSRQSYCLLFSNSKSKDVKQRLEAVANSKNGRELSEIDLETRGPGEILGIKQHGLPELKLAKWNDLELIKKARDFADLVVADQEKYHKVLTHYRKKQQIRN